MQPAPNLVLLKLSRFLDTFAQLGITLGGATENLPRLFWLAPPPYGKNLYHSLFAQRISEHFSSGRDFKTPHGIFTKTFDPPPTVAPTPTVISNRTLPGYTLYKTFHIKCFLRS